METYIDLLPTRVVPEGNNIGATKCVNVKVKYIRSSIPKYQNLKEWMQDSNNVYIGRRGIVFIDGERFPKYDSKWANPFKISSSMSRESVLKKYTEHIIDKINSEELDIEELRGKTLGCWCKPEKCHGDILIELLNIK